MAQVTGEFCEEQLNNMSTDPTQPENLDTPVEETASTGPQLERGTYEIIKSRLQSHATELRSRLGLLNEERRSVFGSIPTELISTQRITCLLYTSPSPRDRTRSRMPSSA